MNGSSCSIDNQDGESSECAVSTISDLLMIAKILKPVPYRDTMTNCFLLLMNSSKKKNKSNIQDTKSNIQLFTKWFNWSWLKVINFLLPLIGSVLFFFLISLKILLNPTSFLIAINFKSNFISLNAECNRQLSIIMEWLKIFLQEVL